jgi:hypothetical protein
MQESSIGIPFRGVQEIHVSTMGVLIQVCSPKGSLIVGLNSSTCSLSESVWNFVCDYVFSTISHSYGIALNCNKLYLHLSVFWSSRSYA